VDDNIEVIASFCGTTSTSESTVKSFWAPLVK